MGIENFCESIYKFEEGSVAEIDIMIGDRVLVKKGTILTDAIIKKLQNLYLENPTLNHMNNEIVKENQKIDVCLDNKDKEMINDVRIKVEKYSEHLNDIFDEIYINNKNNMEEVTAFVKKILKELDSPRSAVKNILLEGSGEDAIFKHSVNVTVISLLLGKWIGLDEKELNFLMRASILHDFGKYKIKDILMKKEKLSKEEFQIIKEHPIIAYKLIKDIPYLNDSIKLGVLMHHERLDGSGYPLKIKTNIHHFARIIAIADTFDALNSNRPYKERKDLFTVLEIIREESLRKLDYNYCNIFIEHIINYYIGENVLLSNGKIAKIIQIDPNNLSKPLLLCEDEFINLKDYANLEVEKLLI